MTKREQVELFPVAKQLWTVWCDDGTDCVFNVANCKTKRAADAIRRHWAKGRPDCEFFVTLEAV